MKLRSPLSILFALSLVWSGLLCASQRGGSVGGPTSAQAACHDCDGPDSEHAPDGAPAKDADHGCPAGFGSCCSTWDVARVDIFAPDLASPGHTTAPSSYFLLGTLADEIRVSLHASRAAPNPSSLPSLTDPQLDVSLQGRAPPHSA